MSLLSLFAVAGYLATLALTQTVYGFGFLSARWYALSLLALVTGADWVLARAQGRTRHGDQTTGRLQLYVLITGATLLFAENRFFSTLRWSTHLIMIVVFLIFVRQVIHVSQVRQMTQLIKAGVISLLAVSWLFPAQLGPYESRKLYRGAMSNANTLGHIAAIAAIVFIHEYLTETRRQKRIVLGAVGALAAMVVWWSGARSSLAALLCSLVLMGFYYRQRMRGMALAGSLLLATAALAFPTVPEELMRFAVKREDHRASFSEQALKTRVPLWQSSWEAFQGRPWFGWGFGADKNITHNWKVSPTALGTVERDAVNDVLWVLEGGGIVGFSAYLLLITVCLRQRPGPEARSLLRRFSLEQPRPSGADMTLVHTHASAFILGASLLILTQFDSTALSAGNFISAMVWISIGCSGSLRAHLQQAVAAHCPQCASQRQLAANECGVPALQHF